MVAGGVCGCGGIWGMCGCRGACVVVGGGVHGGRGACMGYDEIRSMCSRYASYWNAFLLGSLNSVLSSNVEFTFAKASLSFGR